MWQIIEALLQASKQGGLERPYQDNLGGLDKAYKRPSKQPFKGLLEAFLTNFKGI